MTVGELALMFADELELDLDLDIIQCQSWRRDQYFDACGLVWTNPSPNMRSLTQALLYPGIGLLETTNLSVGRGTDTPFEVIGAPWIDARQLARNLNRQGLAGVSFVPIRIRPNASVYADRDCQGINIIVTNRDAFQSVRTGVAIAVTLRDLYPDHWQDRAVRSACCPTRPFSTS